MLRVHRFFLILVLVLTAVPVVRLFAWKGVGPVVPVIQQVAPVQVYPGGAAMVTGFQLDSRHVSELYLSDRETRYPVEILSQSDIEIRFRVPANIPSGYLTFAMKLAGQAALVEQPVLLRILEPVG